MKQLARSAAIRLFTAL